MHSPYSTGQYTLGDRHQPNQDRYNAQGQYYVKNTLQQTVSTLPPKGKPMQYQDIKVGQVLRGTRYSTPYHVIEVKSNRSYPIICADKRGDTSSYGPEDLYSTFEIEGFDIRIYKDKVTFVGSVCKEISFSLANMDLDLLLIEITTRLEKHNLAKAQIAKKIATEAEVLATLVATGANVIPETTILQEVEVHMEIKAENIADRYNEIVGHISHLTSSINESFSLEDTKDLAKVFIEAKMKIEELTSVKPGKISSTFSSFLKKIPGSSKVMTSVKTTLAKNSSIQKNIDHLFGTIHAKYEKLVTVGESLQTAKGHIVAQVSELENLAKESTEDLAQYESETDVPMRKVSLDTQIKSSIAKYRSRLLKIDGSITACQTTIIALGKDLPSLKTDLTDEMAIGSLLNSVDDYQKMYAEIAKLVSSVTESTAEKVHDTIENLMDLQINDNHTKDYIAKSTERSVKFAAMLEDKTTKLAAKVTSDAKFIREVAQGNTIAYAQQSIKKLEY